MKKIFFTVLLFSASTSVLYAQIDIINTTLIEPDSNTAFIGIENIFEIVSAAKEEYVLKTSSSNIERTQKSNTFTIRPHSAGVDTFLVLKEGKPVYSKVFTVFCHLLKLHWVQLMKKLHPENKSLPAKDYLLNHITVNTWKTGQCLATRYKYKVIISKKKTLLFP